MSAMYQKLPVALVDCSSNRRRRTVLEAVAATLDASWASLHEDLVRLIGWRVLANDLLDYVRFRAVCLHWRASTDCPRGRGIVDPRFHPRRWMMLPEGYGLYPGHGKLRGYVRFFNLCSGAFVRVQLPLFRDHCVLDSIDGILLLQRDRDTAIRLLHPFTCEIAELPPLATLLAYVNSSLPGADQEAGKWGYLRNVLAASISVSADGVITVMMSLNCLLRVAFATSGDQQWRVSSWMFDHSYNPLSFQGKMYMMNRRDGEECIFQVNPPQQEERGSDSSWLAPPELIATFPIAGYCYLVECDSEILVVAHILNLRSHFSVYRLADLINERIVPVTSIGGNALFLYARTLSVNSKALPTIVGDTIVFFDMTKLHLAQYHLSSGTLSQAADGRPRTYFVPSPCTIIYHIFTCCCRAQWNKGQIIGQGKRKTNWRVKDKWRHGA